MTKTERIKIARMVLKGKGNKEIVEKTGKSYSVVSNTARLYRRPSTFGLEWCDGWKILPNKLRKDLLKREREFPPKWYRKKELESRDWCIKE